LPSSEGNPEETGLEALLNRMKVKGSRSLVQVGPSFERAEKETADW
jgi:hypothetical protein